MGIMDSDEMDLKDKTFFPSIFLSKVSDAHNNFLGWLRKSCLLLFFWKCLARGAGKTR